MSIIYDDSKLENELFRVYKLHAAARFYEDDAEKYFNTLEDAVYYSLQSGNPSFGEYELSIVAYCKNGKDVITEEINLGKLPNQVLRSVIFYATGTEFEGNLVMKNVVNQTSKALENCYTVYMNLNDDNELECFYKPLERRKTNRKKPIKKR